jgi:hypothetical protein
VAARAALLFDVGVFVVVVGRSSSSSSLALAVVEGSEGERKKLEFDDANLNNDTLSSLLVVVVVTS